MVHPRHLGGFPPDQRTASLLTPRGDPADHAGGGIDIQLAGGVVVEEEQRLGALNHQIVDAHRHQIDADGVMALQIHRQAQLGADAIGAGDQYRLAVFLRQRTQRAKATESSHHLGTASLLDDSLNPVDQGIARIDVYSGVFVTERGFVGHCVNPHGG